MSDMRLDGGSTVNVIAKERRAGPGLVEIQATTDARPADVKGCAQAKVNSG